jgi:putative FmdB family regulatory protein
MPVYEYQCAACQHEFEREQRISEDPIKKCPKCGKLKVKRLISRTSFVLKGGGWYGDLYGSVKPGSEKKDDAGKDAGASASPAASDGGKSDASAAPAESAAKSDKPADAKPAKKGKSKKAAA